MLPVDHGAQKLRAQYTHFVREVLGWYGLGYDRTIQCFGIYHPPDLYERILL